MAGPVQHTASLYLGIDFGTSGCRAAVINSNAELIAGATTPLPAVITEGDTRRQDPRTWWQALETVLDELAQQISLHTIQAITIDGTSGTVLVTDAEGTPLHDALMYHDRRPANYIEKIKLEAPADSPACNASSGLAKLLWLHEQIDASTIKHTCHQADWLVGRLTGMYNRSDVNNCLKTGFDPVQKQWPDWITSLPIKTESLPRVQAPGMPVAPLSRSIAQRFGFADTTMVVSGTTDSTASFIATGASRPGDAVTVLGSTLVLKILSTQPVFASDYGIYSQPLGELWLCGGASNSGGAVLRQYFSDQQLQELTPRLQPDQPTGLDYTPLPAKGERFPVNDPELAPRLEPRPDDNVVFFQAILEGIAAIEHQGYRRLAELGAPYPSRVFTAGGGSVNPAWTAMRQNRLNVPVSIATHTEAAYGSALLALRSAQTRK